MSQNKFWVLGEDKVITPSSKNLSKILNALILLKGRLKSSHSLEIKDFAWRYPTRTCAVIFLIELPDGLESNFSNMTGFTLSEPAIAHLN